MFALLSILKWFIVAMLPFGAGAYFLVTQEKKTAHFDEEESLWDAIVASDKTVRADEIEEDTSADGVLEAAAVDAGWDTTLDATHKTFYYWNKFTGETQWEKPVVAATTAAAPAPPAAPSAPSAAPVAAAVASATEVAAASGASVPVTAPTAVAAAAAQPAVSLDSSTSASAQQADSESGSLQHELESLRAEEARLKRVGGWRTETAADVRAKKGLLKKQMRASSAAA